MELCPSGFFRISPSRWSLYHLLLWVYRPTLYSVVLPQTHSLCLFPGHRGGYFSQFWSQQLVLLASLYLRTIYLYPSCWCHLTYHIHVFLNIQVLMFFCLAIYCPARFHLFFYFFFFFFFFPPSSPFQVKVLQSILNQSAFYLLLSTGSRYIQKLYVLQRGVCGAHPSKSFPSTDRRNKQ